VSDSGVMQELLSSLHYRISEILPDSAHDSVARWGENRLEAEVLNDMIDNESSTPEDRNNCGAESKPTGASCHF
jgi:hypothetical protein